MKKKLFAAYIDLIVCSIMVIIGFTGSKIILSDLLAGTFDKGIITIAVITVIVLILAIVVFGIQIPITIKELKNNSITEHPKPEAKLR